MVEATAISDVWFPTENTWVWFNQNYCPIYNQMFKIKLVLFVGFCWSISAIFWAALFQCGLRGWSIEGFSPVAQNERKVWFLNLANLCQSIVHSELVYCNLVISNPCTQNVLVSDLISSCDRDPSVYPSIHPSVYHRLSVYPSRR